MVRAFGVLALTAALSAGGPHVLRPALPADAAPRTGTSAQTQIWQVLAVDPSTRSSLSLTTDTEAATSGAALQYAPTVPQTGYSETFHDLGPAGTAPGYAIHGITLSHAGTQWRLALDQGTVKVALTFSAVRRGATAAQWPVGQVTGPGTPHYLSTYDWSAPVAAARVDGTIDYDGRHVAISGWRGYVDHTWGRFDLGLGLMQHWDWAVVETPTDAWIADGFESGAGVTQTKGDDALWHGVLVHAGAHGTTSCSAHAVRSGWRNGYFGIESFVYPWAMTLRCGGTSATFTRQRNLDALDRGYALNAAHSSHGGYGIFLELDDVN